MLKIDVFNHVLPQAYFDKVNEVNPGMKDLGKRVRNISVLRDMDQRLRMVEQFGDDYRQVLTVAAPALERIAGPEVTPELAVVANDELARLIDEHDRFIGFVASLPMNNPDASVTEAKRAIDQLGATGVQMFTNVAGSPLDRPEYLPVFELMASYDLPIWVHPERGAEMPDYADEDRSKYEIWWTFGWPYETSAMMARYFVFQTPQFIYYIIPMAALVATLVTIGLMTKNSELVVMRACGISLYRTAAPLLLFGIAASAVLFGLQERVIAYSNREADRLNREIRGLPPASFGALDRRWMIGQR